MTGDDARVEAAAEWIFKRVIRERNAADTVRYGEGYSPISDAWPPAQPGNEPPIAEQWRREARDLLAHIDAAQEAEDG